MFPELDGLTLDEQIATFEADPVHVHSTASEDRQLWLMEVAEQIARSGKPGLDYLAARAPGAGELRLRAIVVAFTLIIKELDSDHTGWLRALCLSLLQDERSAVIAEAVDTLSCLGCDDAAAPILHLFSHPSPYVRGSVLRFLSHHFRDVAKHLLVRALEDSDPIVRQNGIDELDAMVCVDALPWLRRLAEDPDADVRQAADTAVLNLEGLPRQSLPVSGERHNG